MIRLAPYVARCSALSRRQAEEALLQGRVWIDGKMVTDFLVSQVGEVRLDGTLLEPPPTPNLWVYYKPREQIVTRWDPQGRLTVFDALRPKISEKRLLSVGRLDYLSEGLLLVTNTPAMAHGLETSGLKRTYRVWVRGKVDGDRLKKLREGVSIQGTRYRPCSLRLEQSQGETSRFWIALQEGKNREIRILMAWVGASVTRLLRLSFGPFILGSLGVGQVKKVDDEWITKYKENKHSGPHLVGL